MRRLIYAGTIFAMVGTAIVGCKKDNPIQNSDAKNSTIQMSEKSLRYYSNGTFLIFPTVADYDSTITDLSYIEEVELITDLNALNYDSYSEYLDDQGQNAVDRIGEDIMKSVLNKDQIVQIGNYLYRVNKQIEKVFVLPVANVSEYQDLINENKSNKNIRQFSTIDDVIELAESGAEGEKCSESGSSQKSQTQTQTYVDITGTSMDISIVADYNLVFGIAHSLVARFSRPGPMSSNRFSMFIQTEAITYKKKCSSSYGPTSYPWVHDWEVYRREQRYRVYYSTKPLSHFHFRVRGRMEENDRPEGNNPYTTVFTPWAEINN